jgi:hypothetical protein
MGGTWLILSHALDSTKALTIYVLEECIFCLLHMQVQHLHVRQKNTLVKRPVVGDECTTGIGCNQVSQVIQPSHLL